MNVFYTPKQTAAMIRAGTYKVPSGTVLPNEVLFELGYKPGDGGENFTRGTDQKRLEKDYKSWQAKELRAAALDAAAAAAVAPGAAAARLRQHIDAQLADLYQRIDAPALTQGTAGRLESFWSLQEQLSKRNMPISLALDPGLRARFELNGGNLAAALDPAQKFPLASDPARQPRHPGLATDAPGSGARDRLRPLLQRLQELVQDALRGPLTRVTMRQLLTDLRQLDVDLETILNGSRRTPVAA